ncbi:hypothetical protein BD779DRAFT_1792332 [Infundibulicybe gibba]|nr:hypothetical protein BD779DRAFT_1792332 [Infundibulicybe gibba]
MAAVVPCQGHPAGIEGISSSRGHRRVSKQYNAWKTGGDPRQQGQGSKAHECSAPGVCEQSTNWKIHRQVHPISFLVIDGWYQPYSIVKSWNKAITNGSVPSTRRLLTSQDWGREVVGDLPEKGRTRRQRHNTKCECPPEEFPFSKSDMLTEYDNETRYIETQDGDWGRKNDSGNLNALGRLPA